jgi:hypothetical protein
MEYKLNDYHRDLSDDDLLADLKRIAEKNQGKYVSRSFYEKEGLYSATPFIRRWGSWVSALTVAGLKTERSENDYKRIDSKELIADVIRVANALGKNGVSTSVYSQYGRYKVQTVLTRFGNWDKVLESAGLDKTGYKVINDIDLFEEIERLWTEKGSQPTSTDIKNGNSKYSLNTFCRRFGGWKNSLRAFLEYIESGEKNEDIKITEENSCLLRKERDDCEKRTIHKRKTPRDINLRLRFTVLQRDKFSCCICGASPAKDPSVTLHVDHIIPWSKGGETEIDNLQTLCSKCNLGKSDMY